jgi:hypothetical protein
MTAAARAPSTGGANYAMVPYAVTIAIAAVYLRDLGVLGPRQRRGLDAVTGGAPAPAPGVSISIVSADGSISSSSSSSSGGGGNGGGGTVAPPLPLAAADLSTGGGAAHSVAFAFCDS